MPTPYKLVRNTRVFITNAVSGSANTIGTTVSSTDTFELQVLDGFSFSQGTTQTTIQLSEAGATPTRGQRSFNTALNPVDFSFSTYLRPMLGASSVVTAEESVLWNALLSDTKIDSTNKAITIAGGTGFTRASTVTNVCTLACTAMNLTAKGIASGDVVSVSGAAGNYAGEWNTPAVITSLAGGDTACTSLSLAYLNVPAAAAGAAPATYATTLTFAKYAWTTNATQGTSGTAGYNATNAQVHTGQSNKNQLQPFGVLFLIDDIMYAIDNCVLDMVSIDFGLEQIATAQWTGKGAVLRQIATTPTITNNIQTTTSTATNTWSAGTITGTSLGKNSGASYITNKLSTLKLIGKIYGSDGTAGTTYNVALTGGNLSIANNTNFITPANLGVVNQALTYYTGTRAIGGNVTAYLKTGTGYTAQLLSDILAANESETKFRIQIEVGGANNIVHVDFNINAAMLQVPTIATGDLMTTTINFTAQGFDPVAANQLYDLGQTNDLTIKYYA